MSLNSSTEANNATIVVGVIGADCHAVGNKILANIMKRLGFNVINLGVMVTQDEYIDAAIEHNADAIFVSSIYGHGEIDCAGLRQRCQARGLADMILYVGGNLVIGKQNFADVRDKFLAMGYDRVFTPRDDLTEVAGLLNMDIETKESQREQPAVA
ncbi:MAG: methylaspartate mutase subunit S [Kangiellaceae bacterium]|jgi:methylaspartate mutase sigma subunit|nr:methylaspartate mutase subunit S [Kangiellaceae bacterium]